MATSRNHILRDVPTVAADYSMFEAARRIREWLCEISGLISRLDQDPNPFYGSTQDGLVLIEYYGGPSTIGTPFGEWACTGGGTLKDPDWIGKAIKRLGLVLILDEIQNEQGCYGPVWAITKDLDGNALPKTVWSCDKITIGFCCEGLINVHNMPPSELRAALVGTNIVGPDWAPDWVYPPSWSMDASYWDMSYHYSKHLWGEIKKQINFVSWEDKITEDA